MLATYEGGIRLKLYIQAEKSQTVKGATIMYLFTG